VLRLSIKYNADAPTGLRPRGYASNELSEVFMCCLKKIRKIVREVGPYVKDGKESDRLNTLSNFKNALSFHSNQLKVTYYESVIKEICCLARSE